jgi:hypothetical protein
MPIEEDEGECIDCQRADVYATGTYLVPARGGGNCMQQ